MSLELSSISLDLKTGSEGVWFDFFSNAKLKLASSDHPQYKGFLAKLAKRNRVELDDANPEQYEAVQDITCEALARFVLLDWKNVAVNGTAVPYSIELGIDALKSSPKLYDFVTAKAGDISYFNQESIETAKKS